MEILEAIFPYLLEIKKEFYLFLESKAFLTIRIIIGIYVLVVFVDIVLLLFQRPLGEDIRETVFGVNVPKELINKKKKLREKWNRIVSRLDSGNESEYKVAVIEADNLIDEILGEMGYKGENLSEKLEGISEGEIETKIDIIQGHEVRNRIIHDEGFVLDKNKARETLDNFANFLRYFEVL
jgi:hypothetical protein